MDSSSTLTPAHVSPWSKHTLENTTPNYRSLDYEGPDDEASDSNESDDSEEIHTHVGLPLPRVYHSSSIVSSPSGDIFIFGGLGGQQDKNDIWAIRTSGDFGLPTKAKEDSTHMGLTARYVPTAGNAPSPRIGHRSVLADDQLIVWGGSTKKGQSYEMVDSRLYLLNITTNRWTKLDIRPAPSARAAYAACLCGSKFMVFGGKDSKGRCLSDLWSFDLRLLKRGTPNWERIKVSPGSQPLPKSMGHAMVAYENKLYVFGGKNDDSYYNPWCFDLAAGAWAELACIGVVPPQRMNHAVALVGGVVYMFGGRSKDGQDIGDTWSFEIGERMWYKLPSMELEPSIRSGHTLATIGRRVLVVGGWKDNQIMPAEDAFVHILDTGTATEKHYVILIIITNTPRRPD
ncbi:unnamed protein product [Rhizoctonia solani]|uniref:Galactose oxidase n=1 Tax=Rhizoctonia solani TaxID=456999 RepID=A0A8H3HRD0_9AGAM|nr:unnamed protein product [Rhizoctonia solani]